MQIITFYSLWEMMSYEESKQKAGHVVNQNKYISKKSSMLQTSCKYVDTK